MRAFLLLSLVLVLALPLALTACDLDGNAQVYPGASVYEAPDRGFHFHYLSPPWRQLATDRNKWLVHLVVDEPGKEDSTSHKLWVGYHKGTVPKTAADQLRDESKNKGHTISSDVAKITARTGEEGWECHAYKDYPTAGRFYQRHVVFADSSGSLVHFSFWTAYPTDEQDIDELVLSYSAGPDDGTETPSRKPDAAPGDMSVDADAGVVEGGAQ
jgi:hypothetical protein